MDKITDKSTRQNSMKATSLMKNLVLKAKR